jgi:hypothetical protein
MHSDKHVCSLSCELVSLAVGSPCMLFTAPLTVSRVVVAVWVLDVALLIVSRVIAAVVAAVVGCDVVAERWGLGLDKRGWEPGWGAVGRLGSVFHRLQGARGSFGARDKVVEVVVNNVHNVDGSVNVADGGCVSIVNGDVADSSGDGRLGTVSSRCSEVVIADSADIRILSVEFFCMSSAFVSGFGQGAERAGETTRRAQSR